jgi:hypothetical protein
MRILFCCDPLDVRQVDPSYAAEAAAAEKAGLGFSRIDYEALVDEKDAARAVRKVLPPPSGSDLGVYRGWMLSPGSYAELYRALLEKGVRLINSPEAYLHGHHLPESYAKIDGVTPRSVWLPWAGSIPMDAVMELLRPFGSAPLILKDFVKSRKHEWAEACFIPSASDRTAVERVVKRFVELQGDALAGGLVFREFIEFEPAGRHPKSGMPLTREHRVFYLDGRPLLSFAYWADLGQSDDGPPASVFDDVAGRISSRFFTMDVAKRKGGDWLIVELGDGQVAGLPTETLADTFYEALAASVAASS